MTDIEIRGLRNSIINMLNGVPLPLEVKRLVLIEILQEVSSEADKAILAQMPNERKENADEQSA